MMTPSPGLDVMPDAALVRWKTRSDWSAAAPAHCVTQRIANSASNDLEILQFTIMDLKNFPKKREKLI